MRKKLILLLSIITFLVCSCSEPKGVVEVYTTTADRAQTMQKDSIDLLSKGSIKETENCI